MLENRTFTTVSHTFQVCLLLFNCSQHCESEIYSINVSFVWASLNLWHHRSWKFCLNLTQQIEWEHYVASSQSQCNHSNKSVQIRTISSRKNVQKFHNNRWLLVGWMAVWLQQVWWRKHNAYAYSCLMFLSSKTICCSASLSHFGGWGVIPDNKV